MKLSLNLRVACIVAICALISNSAFAAKIKKRNGEVIEGKIRGLVALKILDVKIQVGSIQNKPYRASYVITKGADITAIDENGLQISDEFGSGYCTFIVAGNDKPLDDLAIVRYANYQRQETARYGSGSSTGLGDLSDGTAIFFIEGIKIKGIEAFIKIKGIEIAKNLPGLLQANVQLLGEFRTDKKVDKIIPALEIKTKGGNVTISVEELVEFKKVATQ